MSKPEAILTILQRDEFDVHKPKVSREVDRLLIERLFGIKKVFRPCDVVDANGVRQDGYGEDYHFIPSGKPARTHMIDARPVPQFTEFITPAWQILEALRAVGVWTHIYTHGRCGFRVEMGRPSEQWEAFALSAPLAISVAALKYLIREEG